MSTRISLYCDRTWQDGTCATQLITDATTPTEARTAAAHAGWRSHPDGTDYCPGHSGGTVRPGVTVVHLHPEEP
jgi:hypothetical protein